jgi:hypothetical protein
VCVGPETHATPRRVPARPPHTAAAVAASHGRGTAVGSGDGTAVRVWVGVAMAAYDNTRNDDDSYVDMFHFYSGAWL